MNNLEYIIEAIRKIMFEGPLTKIVDAWLNCNGTIPTLEFFKENFLIKKNILE